MNLILFLSFLIAIIASSLIVNGHEVEMKETLKKQNPKSSRVARSSHNHRHDKQKKVIPSNLHQMHKEENHRNKQKRERKSVKNHRLHKRVEQTYGVSLSSITGFEKPMLPPTILDFNLPINYDQAPEINILQLDLPTNTTLLQQQQQSPREEQATKNMNQ
jgi:transcription initiation factor TFIIIB Brf1 subunit/transcription initiation factor TFIIB